MSSISNPNRCLLYSLGLFCNVPLKRDLKNRHRLRFEDAEITRVRNSLLYLECHFFNFKSQSTSIFLVSFQRNVAKEILRTDTDWDWRMKRWRALCTAYCICSVISSISNPNRSLFSWSLLPRAAEKRWMRLRLEIEMEWPTWLDNVQSVAFGVSFNIDLQSQSIGLFSTDRGKRDVEKWIINFGLRLEKWHIKCIKLQIAAYCIWSVVSSFSDLNRWSSSLGLFCHVPLKRDQGD